MIRDDSMDTSNNGINTLQHRPFDKKKHQYVNINLNLFKVKKSIYCKPGSTVCTSRAYIDFSTLHTISSEFALIIMNKNS